MTADKQFRRFSAVFFSVAYFRAELFQQMQIPHKIPLFSAETRLSRSPEHSPAKLVFFPRFATL